MMTVKRKNLREKPRKGFGFNLPSLKGPSFHLPKFGSRKGKYNVEVGDPPGKEVKDSSIVMGDDFESTESIQKLNIQADDIESTTEVDDVQSSPELFQPKLEEEIVIEPSETVLVESVPDIDFSLPKFDEGADVNEESLSTIPKSDRKEEVVIESIKTDDVKSIPDLNLAGDVTKKTTDITSISHGYKQTNETDDKGRVSS